MVNLQENGCPKKIQPAPQQALRVIFLTAVIDAKEGRDVMTADIPNAFIQAKLPTTKKGDERIVMKCQGILVDFLVEMAPEVYGPYVVFENGVKTLYLQVLRGLYGMLIAALLWYRKFRTDLTKINFKFNPYDPCVANRDTDDGKQQTIRFHVDDVMSSCEDNGKVNDEFELWLNKTYGALTKVKATRGKIHDYLGMLFDFSKPGEVTVEMTTYICNMVDECSVKFAKTDVAPTPAA